MRHQKTNNIADWTQSQLTEAISRGQMPAGTALSDIVLSSDWNNGHTAVISTIADTSYTLLAGDIGKTLRFTSDSSITLTCPNSLSAGFYVWILQMGFGQITPTAASGATIVNRQSLTMTAGKYAYAALLVDVNSDGVTAEYVLGGDLA